ncbi:helix-turn-helix transcriptional regulator [Halioxenophilus sp. WMMB6]|uniref:helix-turn-helix transcriptional regulator n=1 Tax=Halioxenophilus sp. WMMB6 TaxID=3073815 RepID=UPI00295E74E7|nr:AraC family transcriptional regulator ligand-binding domain-containing protein [Halioxenophilus sp. WMMB6]
MSSAASFFSLDGPLDSMPAEGQMRSANLSGFNTLIQRIGGEPRAILEKFDIDPWLARDPDHFIPVKSLVDLLEYCSKAFDEPLFGARLARLQEPDVFGCVTALCRSATNLHESLNRFIDFIPVVHSPSAELRLAIGSEITELHWYVPQTLGRNDQANFQAVVLKLKLLQQIGGPDFRPLYVSLSNEVRERDIAELERYLGCPLRQDIEGDAIAFDTDFLSHPVASANRLIYKLLGGYLDKVKAAARKTTVERVQDYVRGALASRSCTIERCADKLGMSVRTLQSHLSDADQKFSDILEHQRTELAKDYLQQEQLSLDDVAANLGYAEQSSFGRAFKRWTGQTPKQFRRVVLGASADSVSD